MPFLHFDMFQRVHLLPLEFSLLLCLFLRQLFFQFQLLEVLPNLFLLLVHATNKLLRLLCTFAVAVEIIRI